MPLMQSKAFNQCENVKSLPAEAFKHHIFSCQPFCWARTCHGRWSLPDTAESLLPAVFPSALPVLLPPLPSRCSGRCSHVRMWINDGGDRGKTLGTADPSPLQCLDLTWPPMKKYLLEEPAVAMQLLISSSNAFSHLF